MPIFSNSDKPIEPVCFSLPKCDFVDAHLSPTERMLDARPTYSSSYESLIEDHLYIAINGWLSPKGVMYLCPFKHHDNLLRALGFESERDIERSGWCKLSNLRWLASGRYMDRELTEQQIEYIRSWYHENQYPEALCERLIPQKKT